MIYSYIYSIQTFLKQIYQTNRLDPNRYYHSNASNIEQVLHDVASVTQHHLEY